MIVYLYGLPGSGKTYIGKLIAKEFNFYFKDADEYLPKFMKDKLTKGEQFTYKNVEYYHTIISQKVYELSKKHNDIVISQASFFQKHRDMIKSKLYSDIFFIHICSQQDVIVQRLKIRGGSVTPEYMTKMSKYLEVNSKDFQIINNDSYRNDIIIKQCNEIFREIKLHNNL